MIIRRFSVFLLLLPMILLSNKSFAQEFRWALAPAIGQSSFNLNEANIIADYGSLSSSSSFVDNPTSFGILGGVQLDEYLSVELDLLMAGDISANEGGRRFKLFDVSTLALTVMLSHPLGERSRLFARAGVHFWDISQSFGNLDTINTATDPTWGLGADINLYGDRSRQLRIQWNHYEYDGIYLESSDTLSLGLLFLLGS